MSAQATLRGVCADWLAAALEAAPPPADAGAEKAVAAPAVPPQRAPDAAADPAEPEPPAPLATVSVQLTEVAPRAGVFGARAADVLSVDVLRPSADAAPPLPADAVALARLLTGGAPARAWASALWRAGATHVRVRLSPASENLVRSFVYLVADEEAAQDADSRGAWPLPLQAAESTPKPPDMAAGGGFELTLLFRQLRAPSDGVAAALAPADTLPPAPAAAPLAATLAELVSASAQLAPTAHVEMRFGTFGANEAAEPRAEAQVLQEAVLAAVAGVAPSVPLRERLRAAMEAHLRPQRAAAAPAPTGAGDGGGDDTAAAPVAPATGAAEDVTAEDALYVVPDDAAAPAVAPAAGAECVVTFGTAEHASGVGAKRVVWSVFAAVASLLDADQAAPNLDDAAEADAGGAAAAAPKAPTEAPLFCFAQSAVQVAPPLGVLDCLRAKTTSAEWKAACGLQLRGCDTAAEREAAAADAADAVGPARTAAAALPPGACAALRFAPAAVATPHPQLIILHRRCVATPTPRGKPPALGRKNEAALVKAALGAALRGFKAATGGGTAFERGMRANGLPLVAAAVARIAHAGTEEELRAAAAALVRTAQEGRLLPPADDDDDSHDADQPTQERIQAAVLAALLEALQLSTTATTFGGAAAAGAAAEDASREGPSSAVDGDADETMDAEVASPQPAVRGVRPRDEDEDGDDDDATPEDAAADAIFPARRRRVGRSPPRAPAATQSPPAQRHAVLEEDDDDGWFI